MRNDPAARNSSGRSAHGAAGAVATAARALLGNQLRVVSRLAGKGVEIARTIWRQGHPEPDAERPANLSWLVVLYTRAERAVRMAVLLRARLIKELGKLGGEAATDAERARCELYDFTIEASRHVKLQDLLPYVTSSDDETDDAGELEEGEDEDREGKFEARERLDREAPDRFRGDALYQYVMSRPVEELIEEIRGHLGLSVDWLRAAEQDRASMELAAAGREWPAARPMHRPPSSSPWSSCGWPNSAAVASGAARKRNPP